MNEICRKEKRSKRAGKEKLRIKRGGGLEKMNKSRRKEKRSK